MFGSEYNGTCEHVVMQKWGLSSLPYRLCRGLVVNLTASSRSEAFQQKGVVRSGCQEAGHDEKGRLGRGAGPSLRHDIPQPRPLVCKLVSIKMP